MALVRQSTLSKAYPMNGGNGLYSYRRNSAYQGKAIDSTKKLIDDSIAKDLHIEELSSNIFAVADMGCSVGPNTFSVIQNIVEAVERKCQYRGLGSGFLEFQIFLNDHAFNDFNTLFRSLPADRKYYAAGVPGSFHGRLFHDNSLHIVTSSYALQWLSQVPQEVVEKSSAWNKGMVHYMNSSDQTIEVYSNQFAKDMESFLCARAQEIMGGGLVMLIVPGRETGCLLSQVCGIMTYNLLGSCLMDMVRKGILSEEKVDSFNIPVYFASPPELELAVERNGCFSIEKMECLVQEKTQLSVHEKSKIVSFATRAGLEILLEEHFGQEIMDELFESLAERLENSPFFDVGDVYNLFVLLKRKPKDQKKVQT
ncbi:hypothetical protein K2173_026381 [Erythroxylum novogranatense]|uniref:Uncharacterized protein n=1 Tax=Erythroxylum novogranatense TaxID=1862640 RepID=A0AAV8SP74_9ROSI|nr:hypothetical protein K2173_026381 [Erythroxylum novogranatense]